MLSVATILLRAVSGLRWVRANRSSVFFAAAAALSVAVVLAIFLTSDAGEAVAPAWLAAAMPDVFGLRAARRAAASQNIVLATRERGILFRAPHDPRGGSFAAVPIASATTRAPFSSLRRATEATLTTADAAGLPVWMRSLVESAAAAAASSSHPGVSRAPRAVFADCAAPPSDGVTAAMALRSIAAAYTPPGVISRCFSQNVILPQTGLTIDGLYDDGTHSIGVRAGAPDEEGGARLTEGVFLITVPFSVGRMMIGQDRAELVRQFILLHLTRHLRGDSPRAAA